MFAKIVVIPYYKWGAVELARVGGGNISYGMREVEIKANSKFDRYLWGSGGKLHILETMGEYF